MLTTNKKRIVALVLGLAAASATGVAFAGAKWINEHVRVDTVGRTAYGALGFTRNTSNGTEYIGCSTSQWTTGTPYVYCSARNSAGTSVSCGTYNQNLFNTAVNLQGDSYIYFAYDASGYCTYINSENYSGHAPKAL